MSRGPGVVQRAVLKCASLRGTGYGFTVDDVLLSLNRGTGPGPRSPLGTHAERESVLRAMRDLAAAEQIDLSRRTAVVG